MMVALSMIGIEDITTTITILTNGDNYWRRRKTSEKWKKSWRGEGGVDGKGYDRTIIVRVLCAVFAALIGAFSSI